MSIWTRITDFVAAVGDSVSDAIARLTGSTRKPADPQRSVAFTIGMIALGAKMAKADGTVSGVEIDAFRQVFQVQPEEVHNVARVFNLAKQDVAGYEYYARKIGGLFKDQPQVLEDVLDGLFHIAKADGVIQSSEIAYLESVAELFGFGPGDFRRIRSRHLAPDRCDPYVILGLDPQTPDKAIKAHYRQLVRDNHPDRHLAAGVPEEMIAIATEKLARINEAYERIARERGL